jgi:ketosteroid isomerase-like protein
MNLHTRGRHTVHGGRRSSTDAYRTKWEKTSIGFTVIGDWAFERNEYRSTDVEKKTGAVTTYKGKGLNIFRRATDGKWRVAIDGWSSDIPIAK